MDPRFIFDVFAMVWLLPGIFWNVFALITCMFVRFAIRSAKRIQNAVTSFTSLFPSATLPSIPDSGVSILKPPRTCAPCNTDA